MKVVFISEWMGRQPGWMEDISTPIAKSLIERGTVKSLEDDNIPKQEEEVKPSSPTENKRKLFRGGKNKQLTESEENKDK